MAQIQGGNTAYGWVHVHPFGAGCGVDSLYLHKDVPSGSHDGNAGKSGLEAFACGRGLHAFHAHWLCG